MVQEGDDTSPQSAAVTHSGLVCPGPPGGDAEGPSVSPPPEKHRAVGRPSRANQEPSPGGGPSISLMSKTRASAAPSSGSTKVLCGTEYKKGNPTVAVSTGTVCNTLGGKLTEPETKSKPKTKIHSFGGLWTDFSDVYYTK